MKNWNCINLFADDTVVSIAGKGFLDVTNVISSEMGLIYDWLCKNKSKLNTVKTKCMVFGSKYWCKKFAESNCKVHINGVEVENASEIKYLGDVLDPQLSF